MEERFELFYKISFTDIKKCFCQQSNQAIKTFLYLFSIILGVIGNSDYKLLFIFMSF